MKKKQKYSIRHDLIAKEFIFPLNSNLLRFNRLMSLTIDEIGYKYSKSIKISWVHMQVTFNHVQQFSSIQAR